MLELGTKALLRAGRALCRASVERSENAAALPVWEASYAQECSVRIPSPEAAAKRPSNGDGPGRASFEAPIRGAPQDDGIYK